MEFPANWVVLDITDFDTTLPAIHRELIVELFTHLCNTGRILDSYQFSLDGSKALEAYVDLNKILPVNELRGTYAGFLPVLAP